MTAPGVGAVVAASFVAAIETPEAFRRSRDVGAWIGLTPRRYQSGEVDYDGHISRRGDARLRSLLYEAATSILTHVHADSTLRSWGLALKKRLGFKRAAVALARKLAVILHAMWKTGTNFDAGVKFRTSHVTGGVYAFTNWYSNFIAQDLVVATTPAGPLAQATNYADVRIAGVEASGDAPIAMRYGVFTLSGSAAFLRGTIMEGTDPLTGESLAGTPADNITPLRVLTNVRFTDIHGRWWAEYGMRAQTDVTRVAQAMMESPFLIAQDLLSLNGFDVHRIGGGVELGKGRQRVALTFAVENLTNRFYREHFQFAPARGRSFTVGLTFGGAQ